jgi:hypothetical protein
MSPTLARAARKIEGSRRPCLCASTIDAGCGRRFLGFLSGIRMLRWPAQPPQLRLNPAPVKRTWPIPYALSLPVTARQIAAQLSRLSGTSIGKSLSRSGRPRRRARSAKHNTPPS